MREYATLKKDNQRFLTRRANGKSYYTSLKKVRQSLEQPQGRANRLLGKDILNVLAAALGQTGELPITWRGSPLMLRTSPSGGARNPTEGYLFSFGIHGLRDGGYHFNSGKYRLDRISAIAAVSIKELFPVTWARCPFEPKATIALTSVFSRNMFRYREPRTFRSVHLDAGHIVATIEMVSEQLGIRNFVSYAENQKKISDVLKIKPLSEGLMAYVSLGLRK
jgi:SagB-type dehydrogenase family enzyme